MIYLRLVNLIGCKWIFQKKMRIDGTIDNFKARLVAQGFWQKHGIDHFDTYAPVVRTTTIRLLVALASIQNLLIHQMDVKTAFFVENYTKKYIWNNLKGLFWKDMRIRCVNLQSRYTK